MADNTAAAEDLKAKGNAALSAKNFEEAVKFYTSAIELNGSNHVYYSNRSAAYLSSGNAEAALADAETCVQLKPDWIKGYNRKGAALHALRRWNDAIETYEAGLKINPEDQSLLSAKAEVERISSSSMPKNPFGADLLNRLALHPKYREYLGDTEFVSKLQKLQTDPSSISTLMNDDPRLLEVLGFAMGVPMEGLNEAQSRTPEPVQKKPAKKEEPQKEETPEEKAKRERKEKAVERKNEGNQLYKQKKFEDALKCYDEALEIDPEDITYRLNKASVYLEQNEVDKSIEECKKAIEFGREHRAPFSALAKAFARIGNAHMKRKDYEPAIQAYEDSLTESYTADVESKVKRARTLLKKKQDDEYLDPEKAEEAKTKGNDAFREGKFPEAIEHYTEAIKRDPSKATYWANRATARSKMMDFNTAYDDCNKALALDPTYVKAWARRGNIEFMQKEYHKALESFRKGLEIDSNNQECQEGSQRTVMKINETQQGGEMDQERVARAAADPEIQNILRDPMVNQALKDLSTDPAAAQRVLRDPVMASKIEKLIAAGVVRTQ